MRHLLAFLMASAISAATAQTSTGDYHIFRKHAAVGDSGRYVPKVNNSLWSLNANGMLTFLAQSNFANASHTHLSSAITDASFGGNGSADSGLLLKFNTEGQIRGSVGNSTTGAVVGESTGTGYAGYFNSSGAGETTKTINGSTGSGLFASSSNGHGVDAESTFGIPLHVHAVDVGGTDPDIAEFAEGLSETVRLRVRSDGGLNWTGTGAQTTATALPAFASSTKGVVPASGGGTSNYLRADGTWATPASGGAWGSITGTLGNQTDLANSLDFITNLVYTESNDRVNVDMALDNEKEDAITAGTTSQYWRGDKSWQTLNSTAVGLANVENTALSTWAGTTNITTLGNISSGAWNASRVGPIYGGTGIDSYTLGDLLYADDTDNLAKLAGNTTTTRTFLSQTGNGSVSAAPAWREITTSDVSGLGTLATQSGTFSGTHSGTSSGTNTGDQTSIVGITGTTAQFNTALSDGDFATGGGTATGTNTGDQTITLTGDVTGSGTGSFAATIASGVIVNADINASAAIALSKLATDPLARANHTGTQAVSTISDATTVGQNLVKLTNPSAITYARMNADNTVTARTMAQSRTDLALHPVTITAITGGTQATTSTSLADVTGSTITFPDTGWYEFEYFIIHNSAATTTGAFFAVNTGGTMVKDYLTYCTHYDVSSTDKDTYCSDGFNAVIASTSSRNASATNRDRMQGTIHVTTAGTMVLRFATEVGSSAITITDLSGWYRNL